VDQDGIPPPGRGLGEGDGRSKPAHGTDGVVHVVRSILAEADLLMAVDGYLTIADLTPQALHRQA